jgi:anti-sigma-K factor RskA
MNQAPQNRDLVDRLAAEYVLGTLRGQARRRLERWRLSTPLVDERCRFWEEQLMSLLTNLRTLQPPSDAWERIRSRLSLPDSSPQRLTRVRSWAVAAAVVLVAGFAALWHWHSATLERTTEVAAFSTPTGTALWNVEVYGNAQGLASVQVKAGQSARPPDGRDYELWALPKGGAPVSLGVLPYQANAVRRSLSSVQRAALAVAGQLAVSVEPIGGSPTGQPTGAVVYVVPLRAISS